MSVSASVFLCDDIVSLIVYFLVEQVVFPALPQGAVRAGPRNPAATDAKANNTFASQPMPAPPAAGTRCVSTVSRCDAVCTNACGVGDCLRPPPVFFPPVILLHARDLVALIAPDVARFHLHFGSKGPKVASLPFCRRLQGASFPRRRNTERELDL